MAGDMRLPSAELRGVGEIEDLTSAGFPENGGYAFMNIKPISCYDCGARLDDVPLRIVKSPLAFARGLALMEKDWLEKKHP
jgi:hypothetical protein